MAGIAEEIEEVELGLPLSSVAAQCLDDRPGREPLVDEQGERGDVEREPLALPAQLGTAATWP